MIIDDIYADLGGPGSAFNGITFGLSQGNTYKLHSSPNLWGQNPADFTYAPCSQDLLSGLKEVGGSARYTVDIATLNPLADGLFLESLKTGLQLGGEHSPESGIYAAENDRSSASPGLSWPSQGRSRSRRRYQLWRETRREEHTGQRGGFARGRTQSNTRCPSSSIPSRIRHNAPGRE
jgi:hypothetical protein